MMRSKKTLYLIPAALLLIIGTGLGMKLEATLSSEDTLEQLQKLKDAFLIVNQHYVEEVKAEKTAKNAIEGMLKELDPHSSYISAERVKEMRERYRGSFGGVGIYFEVAKDTARVNSTIAGGPSEEVGVLAGDRIVAINDSSAIGIDQEEVKDRLKGKIGTTVQMTVERQGSSKRTTFTITRGEIPLHTISSSYLLEDGRTGFIKLERFAQSTPKEFRKRLQKLEEQGMERLILDLRQNPGGVMSAAVEVADEMLGGRQTVVYTKGRQKQFNSIHRSSSSGLLEQAPVILLVDEFSASASEIVAGALQDHDRGLIVGQRTFGKGLVQKPFELTDGSVLQMTVSRYYTPAGRLIQTPYEDGDRKDYYKRKLKSLNKTAYDVSDYVENVPDSLKYETDHGRAVFGGGGILPDYFIPHDSTQTPLMQFARGNNLRVFAHGWFLEHEQELRERWGDEQPTFRGQFNVDKEMLQSFWSFAEAYEDADFDLTTDTAKVSLEDHVFAVSDVEQDRTYFETYLKAYLANKLFGYGAQYPILNKVDPELLKALDLWNRAEKLATYHATSKASSTGATDDF